MVDQPRLIRVFISSPGDVNAERVQVRRIIEALQRDPLYKAQMQIEIVAWDAPDSDVLMPVTLTPQQAIDLGLPKPSDCDIVLTIFWGRMGTPLDRDTHGTKHDGTPYWSGTEWEYLDGVRGSRSHPQGLPVVYLYRRTDPPPPTRVREGQDQIDADLEHATQRKRVRDFFAQFRDAESGAFKAYYHEYDSPDAFKDLAEKHIRILLNHVHKIRAAPELAAAVIPAEEPLIPPSWDIATQGSPFPGLKPFDERHEPVFFGRAREVAQLISRLSSQRLLVVVGYSGSGKSSLVRAGLLPKLRDSAIPGSALWQRVTFKPNVSPFLSLAEALIGQVPELAGDPAQFVERCQALAQTLAAAPDNLGRTLAGALSERPAAEVLLFIDQFEELFALSSDATLHERFLAMLKTPSERLRVVLTVRSDFYDALVPYLAEELREATFTLARPSPFALHEMIVRPAERAGLIFDDGLVTRILDDTGANPGALALLAYALDELYQVYRASGTQDGRLTQAAYDDFGGVQGVIGSRAENVFRSLDAAAQAALPAVFSRLVKVDERGIPVRFRVSRARVAESPGARQFVEKLAQARLLVYGSDADSQPTVEVAHEALLSAWPRLQTWVTKNRDFLLWKQGFEADAAAWRASGCHTSYEYTGLKLANAVSQAAVSPDELDAQERQFLDASRRADRRRRVARWTAAAIAIALPVIISLVTLGYLAQQEMLRQAAAGPQVSFAASWALVGSGDEPLRRVQVPAFSLDQYLVSYRQYRLCVQASACSRPLETVETGGFDTADERLPVVSVTAYQAADFCRWIGRRLPSSLEWERALRGTDGRPWPWGTGTPVPGQIHVEQPWSVGPAPVDDPAFSSGATPEGILHLIGNVWEWTRTPASCDPYDCPDAELWDGYDKISAVYVQGFGWLSPLSPPQFIAEGVATTPILFNEETGFRCAGF